MDTAGLVGLLLCVVAVVAILVLLWHLTRPRPSPQGAPLAYGVDFSWSRPTAEDLRAAGYSFVCRYLSWSTSGKNLTPDEAAYWQANDFDIVSNWEYYAEAPKGGWAQGVEDATEALRQHQWCGGGEADPVYFSVDYDVPMSTYAHEPWWQRLWRWLLRLVAHVRRGAIGVLHGVPAEYMPVADYMRGAASVMGGVERVGAYGEYDVVRQLFNDGLIAYGWQTYAWSYGWWEPRAQLRQVQNGITVGGEEVDRDEAWAPNYGQWGARAPTPQLPGGAVLLPCPFDPTRVDLFYIGAANEVYHQWWNGGIDAMWATTGGLENLGGYLHVGTLTAMWTPDGNELTIAGLGIPDTADGPAGLGQYWAMRLDRYGQRSGWGSVVDAYGRPPSGVALR